MDTIFITTIVLFVAFIVSGYEFTRKGKEWARYLMNISGLTLSGAFMVWAIRDQSVIIFIVSLGWVLVALVAWRIKKPTKPKLQV